MLMDPLTIKINYSLARAHALVLHVGVWLARRHVRIHNDLPNKNQVSSARQKTHLGPIEEDKLPPGVVPIDLIVLYAVLIAAVVQQEKPS